MSAAPAGAAVPLTHCCAPQVLADAVARLVLDKFGDLTDNFSSPHARRKVLSGVVMTTGKPLVLLVCLISPHDGGMLPGGGHPCSVC